jgi:hypothetical protein
VANERLSMRDWRLLARFFAAQDVRTPARLRENLKRWPADLPGLMQESVTRSVARLEAMTAEQRDALNRDTPPVDDHFPFRATVERSQDGGGWVKSETISGRGLWLWNINRVLDGGALDVLCQHQCTILAPPDGESWFTSDDPVLKLNISSPTEYHFRGGWGSKGTNLILPLSPQHLLYTQVGEPIPPVGAQLSPSHAAIVRRLIAEHAHRFVFANSPDGSVPILRPRTVNADVLKREKAEWASWHAEQTAAERRLMGW